MGQLIVGWVLFGAGIFFAVVSVLLKLSGVTESFILINPVVGVIIAIAIAIGFVFIGAGTLATALP